MDIFITSLKRKQHILLKLFAMTFLLATQGLNSAEMPKFVESIDAEFASLEKLYQHFHTHPELSLQEKETSTKLAAELRSAGLQVSTNIGGFGVVGVLTNGAGPTVLIRADMDALPVKEQTGLPYASKARTKDELGKEVDVMHACGHDVHMTSLVGSARVLQKLKDRWKGTLVFIGQPAEEKIKGADMMLKDGLFARFPKPNYCIALHVNAELPTGTVGVVPGYAMANVNAVDITIRGIGGHGAWPHKTKDPIVLASQTVLALQTIVSREKEPQEAAVVTVGSIHGGTKNNIIPDEVNLQLTVRTFSEEVREHTLEAIKRIPRGLAIAAGLPEDRMPIVKISDETTPAVYNTPELSTRLESLFKQVFGPENVLKRKPSMGGEDFGLFGRTAEKIPICMFWVGSVARDKYEESVKSGKSLPSLHSALYAPVLEPTLKTAIMATCSAVFDLTSGK